MHTEPLSTRSIGYWNILWLSWRPCNHQPSSCAWDKFGILHCLNTRIWAIKSCGTRNFSLVKVRSDHLFQLQYLNSNKIFLIMRLWDTLYNWASWAALEFVESKSTKTLFMWRLSNDKILFLVSYLKTTEDWSEHHQRDMARS